LILNAVLLSNSWFPGLQRRGRSREMNVDDRKRGNSMLPHELNRNKYILLAD
jgi:hypothetical protein